CARGPFVLQFPVRFDVW
nr:immunoglobulin heavy chain junction region [Macaca mulatta]MOW87461.1 immunoglobulin heavy chain junction region [Macaca mulatta]